jgi:hypothetical protein
MIPVQLTQIFIVIFKNLNYFNFSPKYEQILFN